MAAADRNLGVFQSWSALAFEEDGNTVCMMWSQPAKSEGDYTKRGDIYAFVTHRPAERRLNQVSLENGYAFRPTSKVKVTIDSSQSFSLRTDSSTAWGYESADERKMVNAMRAGQKMTVEGVSSRGTNTVDVYSLKGFTAAHKAINKACKTD